MTSMADAIAIASGVVSVIVLIVALRRRRSRPREHFSARAAEVARGASEVFAPTCGSAPYAVYRDRVADADPVQYADVRGLWRERFGGDCAAAARGSLHPDDVERLV
jgi:hypothetical protein